MIKHYTQYSKEAQDEHNRRHQFKIEGLTWAALALFGALYLLLH